MHLLQLGGGSQLVKLGGEVQLQGCQLVQPRHMFLYLYFLSELPLQQSLCWWKVHYKQLFQQPLVPLLCVHDGAGERDQVSVVDDALEEEEDG